MGLILAAGLAVPSPLLAQSSRLEGTWKLNVARSKYSPDPPPKAVTLKWEAVPGGLKLTTDSVSAEGETTHTETLGRRRARGRRRRCRDADDPGAQAHQRSHLRRDRPEQPQDYDEPPAADFAGWQDADDDGQRGEPPGSADQRRRRLREAVAREPASAASGEVEASAKNGDTVRNGKSASI